LEKERSHADSRITQPTIGSRYARNAAGVAPSSGGDATRPCRQRVKRPALMLARTLQARTCQQLLGRHRRHRHGLRQRAQTPKRPKSHILATILATLLAKFVYEPLARDGGNLDVRFLIWVGRGNSPAKRLRSAWAMCMVQRRGFALVATWIWGVDDQIKHRAAGRR
jgi:hypothetical protein